MCEGIICPAVCLFLLFKITESETEPEATGWGWTNHLLYACGFPQCVCVRKLNMHMCG